MLREFTFICICYNQENLIVEHLNSIKEIVLKYGSEIVNDLIIADDFSKDNTVFNAKKWIEDNKSLFRNAEVLTAASNMGTVNNLLRAVDECKTKEFKILAGDDKYALNDIYKIYASIGDSIVVTPIIPFGTIEDRNNKLIVSFRRNYRLLLHYNSKNNIGELLRFRNYLLAPGVFIKSDYWRSNEIRELLSNYKFIEDYPMWMFLINEKKTPVIFEPQAYVYYRITANTALPPENDISIRKADLDKIKEMFPQRLIDRRKYFKLVYYKYLINRIRFSFSSKYDSFFEDKRVEQIYFESIKK